MKNLLSLRRLSAFLTQQPLGPARATARASQDGGLGADDLPERKRTSTMAKGAALLGGMGGFYAISVLCHALAVGVIATVPLTLGPMMRAKARHRPVNTEVKPAAEAPSFEFVAGDGGGVRSKKQVEGTGIRTSDEQKPQNDPAKTAGQVAAVPEPVDPAGEAADAQAGEAALTAALVWLARHQEPDGHWSLVGFEDRCYEGHCGGAGDIRSDAAATGLALLPLLQTTDVVTTSARGQETIVRGIRWLLEHQRQDGDLSVQGEQRMYSHAAAGLALCQYYAITHDERVGAAVQGAVQFTMAAQNPTTGGWHYDPGGRGNTSSLAWQIMFLKAAQSCGLQVDPQCWTRARHWLQAVSQGRSGGLFCYEPQRIVTPTMTCVGLLELQYRGVRVEDPAMIEGRAYLLAHPPDKVFGRDVFYWYLGSHVVRNHGQLEWKSWFRRLRRDLIDAQVKSGCAAGSWYLGRSAPELWSVHAGRLLTTSLAAQLLASGSQRPLPGSAAPTPVATAARASKDRR
jgi:hypothetical protein